MWRSANTARCVLSMVVLALGAGPAFAEDAPAPARVEASLPAAAGVDMRVYFVGGALVDADTRPRMVGQMRVVELAPRGVDAPPAIVLLPGLGLPASLYLGTPDGRPGWAQRFADLGFRVFAVDPVNTGPSGIDAGALEAGAGLAVWDLQMRRGNLWRRWGFGDEVGVPYEDVRYPVADIERLYASFPIRLARGRGNRGDAGAAPDVAALLALLERAGGAAVLAHSFAWNSAAGVLAQRPDLVQALVAVETTGCPDGEAFPRGLPFLAVYGDYIESRGQRGRFEQCRAAVSRLGEGGGDATLLELTALGIRGNTHLMMQDDNSADIADRIAQWLRTR